MTVLLVAVGGAAGAVLRYMVDAWAAARFGRRFPVGTLLVNVAGSLLLGLLAGAAVAYPWGTLLGTGFCGALTTYSTFGAETVRLAQGRHTALAALNVLVNVTLCVTAAFLGFASTS